MCFFFQAEDGICFFFKQKTAYDIGVRLVGSEMCIRDSPYLLPFAWGQRLCGYLREGPVLGSVKEIVKTGRKRKEILREYGIFGEKRR